MTTSERLDARPDRREGAAPRSALYSALIGVTSVLVLLQALWAGLFIQEGKAYDTTWVEVHARAADVAILLAAVATVVAFVKLRERTDLWLGTAALTLVLLLEAYVGGLIGEQSWLTAVHFPLAMALMALVVWLPLRARRRG